MKLSFKSEKGIIWFCAPIVITSVLALFLVIFILPAAWGIGEQKKSEGATGPVTTTNPEKTQWKIYFQNVESLLKTPWEFVAAITWNETGFGANLGNCSYNPPAPLGGHVLTIGNGLRSIEDKLTFDKIVEKLGLPNNIGVSCNPIGSNGGAMGYTQVMPIEWASYSEVLGPLLKHYPNPWDAQDAVYMAGLILKAKIKLGVDDVFPEDEYHIKLAAGRYYGDPSSSYVDRAYARYLEIKATQELP